MRRRRQDVPQRKKRDLTEGLTHLNEDDTVSRHADWLATRLRECERSFGELTSSLLQLLARWPQELANRLLRGEIWAGPRRNYPLTAAYRGAVDVFLDLIRREGLKDALLHIMQLRFIENGLPHQLGFDPLLEILPPLDWTLFGEGRVLLPWFAELAQDETRLQRFTAALWLSELAPQTPGLAELLLEGLSHDGLPEDLLCELAYPPSSGKYLPVWGLLPVKNALRILPLSGAAPFPLIGDPVYCHAADFVFRTGCHRSDLLGTLVGALGHEEHNVRRLAALSLYFCPEDVTPALAELVKALRHPDRYVERMIALTLKRAGLIGFREVEGPSVETCWEYYLGEKAAAIRGTQEQRPPN